MAIYQFVIELIPSQWVKKNLGKVDALFEEEMYDPYIAWKNFPLSIDIEPFLSDIMPKAKTWNSSLKIWGNPEINDIQVWLDDNNQIESIKCRFDLRQDVENLIVKVLDLAKKLNCMLLIPNTRQIIAPEAEALVNIIRQSNAAKFVQDPIGFLSKIKDHTDDS